MKKSGMVALLPLFAGCGYAFGAGVHYEEGYGSAARADVYADGPRYDYDYGRHVSYRRLPIPRGHLPPPGRCRVWLPGVPPGHQARSGPCRVVERRIPRGAWLWIRPVRYPEIVELVAFDARGRGTSVRYAYDVRSGRRVNLH